jgi:hypothetical protein
MDEAEINNVLVEYRGNYPALINFSQAAEISQRPLGTIYDWSSRGLLESFLSRRGKWCLLRRDGFVRWLSSGEPRRKARGKPCSPAATTEVKATINT